MKLSISLSPAEVAAVDKYARASGLNSRSAVIQHAVRQLEEPELEDAYVQAWQEWEDSGEAAAWAVTSADGIADAAR